MKKWSKTGDGEGKWINSMNDEHDTEQRHLWLIGSVNLKQEWLKSHFIWETHEDRSLQCWHVTKYINGILWHRKMSAFYEDDNDVHHCSNSWRSSWSEWWKLTMAMVPLSTFVYLLRDKLNLENWNVWIDHAIVTMIFFCSFATAYSHSKVSEINWKNDYNLFPIYCLEKWTYSKWMLCWILHRLFFLSFLVLCTKTNDECIDA